jgi:hypothetical protein
MVQVVVLEDPVDIAEGMEVVAPRRVKVLEAGRQAVIIHVEVMRHLAVLGSSTSMVGTVAIPFIKPPQEHFMETLFYYHCWAVRGAVVRLLLRVLPLVAVVVVARF